MVLRGAPTRGIYEGSKVLFDIFLGMSTGTGRRRRRSSSTKKPCRDGGLQLIATWDQSLTKKKDLLIRSLGMEEGSLARGQMSKKVCGFFCRIFGIQKGGRLRTEALMEAVVKQMRTTRHLWLVACDNMNPEDFKKSLGLTEKSMFFETLDERISTCRSKDANDELIRRTYDYVIANQSLQGKIKDMEVVEDFE